MVKIILGSLGLCLLIFFGCSKNYSDAAKRVTFMGDSHIKGWDLERQFPLIVPENQGVGGAEVLDLLERVEKININAQDAIFIEIGTNDCRKGLRRNKSESEILADLETHLSALFEVLGEFPFEVKVLSVFPPGQGELDAELLKIYPQLNELLREKCTDKANLNFISVFKNLQNEEGFLKSKYTQDGLHLNNAGYDLISAQVRNFIYE